MIINNSARNKLWLAVIGDEQGAREQRRLASALIAASGSKPGGCGLQVELSSELSPAAGPGFVSYFIGDPCAASHPGGMRGVAPRYPWEKRFFVAVYDAQGVSPQALALGAGTSDYEQSTLIRVDAGARHFFGVRRDWAEREAGPAAATADAWLLGVGDKLALGLGHWDINQPAGPQNEIADVYVPSVDPKQPSDIVLRRGETLSVYRVDSSRPALTPLTMRLPPELRRMIAALKSSW